jgi:hypothetical protein
MDHLSNERFWSELNKAFEQSKEPIRFFDALYKFGVFKYVKFFNSIWGDVTQFDVTTTWKRVLEEMDFISIENRMVSFVALTAVPTAKFPAAIADISLLHSLLQRSFKLKTGNAQDVLSLIVSSKAFGENLSCVRSVIDTMRICERAGFKSLPMSSSEFERAVIAARKITSAPYQHLEGIAIGEAMRADRLEAIDSTFMRQLKYR